jgi:bifunctional UDP-N-acetylglucosamine pyrophosphorylase/glucosamine-1-phosphate N-acetyltransferase
MIAPETVFFAHDTVIEEDATLMPYITFGLGAHIKGGAQILSFCHIEDSVIDMGASVGPFAHLRGGNYIGEHAAIGNFVEVKNTTLHPKAKAKHLTYLGDAEVGVSTNIGAGTITCNYDGTYKHKTVLGDSVFIGANVTLIAPVTVHNGARVGAGSVITKDVPSDTLALGRARQINKEK